MKRSFAIAALLAGFVLSANAQQIWNASAVVAVPNFQSDGTQRLRTWDPGVNGKGIRLRDLFIGSTFAYIDVTAPHGVTFKKINLRAEGSVSGSVRAEFFKQRRDGNAAGAVLLGTVTTVGGGFQFVSSALPAPELIDRVLWSYYIRLTLKRDVSLGAPTAYDVSLTQ